MSNFTRTLSTNDAYRIKIQNVEKDTDHQIGAMFEENKMIDKKIKKLEMQNIAPGCLTRLVRFAFGLLSILILLFFIVFWSEGSLSEPNFVYFYLVAAVIIGIYISLIVRHRKILEKTQRRDEEISLYKRKKKEIHFKINQLEKIKVKKISEIEAEYSLHLEKQSEALENEMQHQPVVEINETKECPRCAEVIKQKAKVCRFCKYEMG